MRRLKLSLPLTAALIFALAAVALWTPADGITPPAAAQTTVTVQLELDRYNTHEGDSLYPRLTFSPATAAAATFTVNATAGTASAGSDFTAGPFTVEVPAGATEKPFSIHTPQDHTIEGPEEFTISIATPTSGYSLGTNASATVRVIDVHRVSNNWRFTPSGLSEGKKFRLVFISTDARDAQSSDIEVYRTWIRSQVASHGHADILPYKDGFEPIGSTATVDAHVNTATTPSPQTGTRKFSAVTTWSNVIYWLGGDKIADDHDDFWDGSWDAQAAADTRDASGSAVSAASRHWTGTKSDPGITNGGQKSGNPLGHTGIHVTQGQWGHNPIQNTAEPKTATRRMLGISQIFEVVVEPQISVDRGQRRSDPSDPNSKIETVTEVSEGETAPFVIRANPAPLSDLTVTLNVTEDDTHGRDYVAAGNQGSKTVTIPANQNSVAFDVNITDDSADEPDGAVTVTAVDGAGYGAGKASSIKARDDDDTTVAISAIQGASASPVDINEGQTKQVTITLGRSLIPGERLRVPILFGGTAARSVCAAAGIDVEIAEVNPRPAHVTFLELAVPSCDGNGNQVDDTMGKASLLVEVPAGATTVSASQFSFQVTAVQEPVYVAESTETLTIQLDNRPRPTTVNAGYYGYHSTGLGESKELRGDGDIYVNPAVWTLNVIDVPYTTGGQFTWLDQSETACQPSGTPSQLSMREDESGKDCYIYLGPPNAGPDHTPVAPIGNLTYTVASSDTGLVKLQDPYSTPSTPQAQLTVSFDNSNYTSQHRIKLIPQSYDDQGSNTATITQTLSGGGAPYASLVGTRTFNVKITENTNKPSTAVTGVSALKKGSHLWVDWQAVAHASYYQINWTVTPVNSVTSKSGVAKNHNGNRLIDVVNTGSPGSVDVTGHLDSIHVTVTPVYDDGSGTTETYTNLAGEYRGDFTEPTSAVANVEVSANGTDGGRCDAEVNWDPLDRAVSYAVQWGPDADHLNQLPSTVVGTSETIEHYIAAGESLLVRVTPKYLRSDGEHALASSGISGEATTTVVAVSSRECTPQVLADARNYARAAFDWHTNNDGPNEGLFWRILNTLGADNLPAKPSDVTDETVTAQYVSDFSDGKHWGGWKTINTAMSKYATPEVSVAVDRAVITEGGTVTFTISASPLPEIDLPVNVSVTKTGDYGVSTGAQTVTIPTSGSATLTVTTSDDNVDEADGSITVTVDDGDYYFVVAAANMATLSVADDDLSDDQKRAEKIASCKASHGDAWTTAHAQHGAAGSADHTRNWKRALIAFDEVTDANLTPLTVAEAQVGEQYWTGWTPVRQALECLE